MVRSLPALRGGSSVEVAYDVREALGGGYMAVGCTASAGAGSFDIYLIHAQAANGDSIWTRTYGGTEYDTGYSLVTASDNTYVIVGARGLTAPAAWTRI